MILRLVRARVLPGRLDALRAGLVGLLPQARSTPGLLRTHVGTSRTGDDVEIAFVTIWESAEAEIAAIGKDVVRPAQLDGISEHVAVEGVDHFEVDDSALRSPDAVPMVLRVATGWIDLGPDAEIQQELRRRMHALPDDMVEGYVGRRMRGGTVEIAFVTTWARASDDRPLEEPIWPDISAQYRSFSVETYEPVVATT